MKCVRPSGSYGFLLTYQPASSVQTGTRAFLGSLFIDLKAVWIFTYIIYLVYKKAILLEKQEKSAKHVTYIVKTFGYIYSIPMIYYTLSNKSAEREHKLYSFLGLTTMHANGLELSWLHSKKYRQFQLKKSLQLFTLVDEFSQMRRLSSAEP